MDAEANNSREESGKPRLRAAIYCRIGRKENEIGAELLLAQKERLLKICKEKNYCIVSICEDICTVYPHNIGENYQAVLSMIKSGKVDVLLATDMGRLTRNVHEMFDLISLAQVHGVKIIDQSGHDITEINRALSQKKR